MRYTEAQLLRSEISTVERFLEETPVDGLIMRTTWEHRLAVLRERLAEAEARPRSYPLSITFRGAPVDGTHSIDATFASKAVRAFVEATDTVAASLMTGGDLRDRGRLPGGGNRSLRIVDKAVGSFGFEMELPPEPQEALWPATPDASDVHVDAIDATLQLLSEAATNDEDALSDLIAEVHPRAATKVREFAEVLVKHSAFCAVAFRDVQLRLDDNDQLRRVTAALADSDISDEEVTLTGTVIGVLPESRRFEARLATGEVLSGKIPRAIPDVPGFKRQWENVEASLTFRVTRVRVQRRYNLVAASELSDPHGPTNATPDGTA